MGFKSESEESRQLNISNIYQVGRLRFYSTEDYLIFKNIDKNISKTVELVKNGSIDLEEVFNNIKKIRVIEFEYDAREELYGLFKNATSLLCFEGTHFFTEYKVGCRFFDKIIIVKYIDSDDDSDDDF